MLLWLWFASLRTYIRIILGQMTPPKLKRLFSQLKRVGVQPKAAVRPAQIMHGTAWYSH